MYTNSKSVLLFRRVRSLWIFSVLLVIVTTSLPIATAQEYVGSCARLTNGSSTDPLDTVWCIEEKINTIDYEKEFDRIKDQIDFDEIIEKYVNVEYFEDLIGISLAGLIVIIIIILSLPSLIIIGSLFLCCWAFNLCCFAKKYQRLHEMHPATIQLQAPLSSAPPPALAAKPFGQQPPPQMVPRFTMNKPANLQQPQYNNGYPTASNAGWRNPPNQGYNPDYD